MTDDLPALVRTVVERVGEQAPDYINAMAFAAQSSVLDLRRLENWVRDVVEDWLVQRGFSLHYSDGTHDIEGYYWSEDCTEDVLTDPAPDRCRAALKAVMGVPE